MIRLPRRSLFSALLVLPVACAELATPRGPLAPPAGLLGDAPDPGRAAITALDEAFRNGGAGLREPAALARAAAVLEWLAADLQTNPRWAPVPSNLRDRVVAAREEMRVALGLMTGIPSPDAARALADASAALDRGDRRAAVNALGGGRFRHGGERTLERLGNPGPLPVGEIAMGLLAQEVARLDRTNGWVVQPAIDPSYEGTRVLRLGV